MTQCKKILQYMEKHGSITQAEAVSEFHCYRLGARVFDLKAQGIPIKTETVTGKREDGAKYLFARYSLIKEDEPCNEVQ